MPGPKSPLTEVVVASRSGRTFMSADAAMVATRARSGVSAKPRLVAVTLANSLIFLRSRPTSTRSRAR